MHPDLERAVTEIREEAIDAAVVEAAAARVWARLAEAAHPAPAEHIRDCAGFQALFPDYRAGRLSEARTLLVKDHLHACVACRRVFEGKVVAISPRPPVRRARRASMRWAVARRRGGCRRRPVWIAVDRLGDRTTRAMVQSVNGNLYVISEAGFCRWRRARTCRTMSRSARPRTPTRCCVCTTARGWNCASAPIFPLPHPAGDLSVRLGRGSIIVEAAKRRSGHLYVNTADCRVAVTGTVFSVNAGMKGSRISVVQGEVHVAQENQEKVCIRATRPSPAEPGTDAVREDFAWSRDLRPLVPGSCAPGAGCACRAFSPLLARARPPPFSSSASQSRRVPGSGAAVLRRKLAQSPELRA